MGRILVIIAVLLLAVPAVADTSYPASLPMMSGENDNTTYQNFQVAGEDVAGVVGNDDYTMGVGLASMIFMPLLPTPGTYIPSVPGSAGEAISYPNPFNPETETANIAYRYAQDVDVKIHIMDITGAIIRTYSSNSASRAADGYSRVTWDGLTAFGNRVPNGVYLVQVVHNGKTIAKTKIMAIR